MSVLQLPFYLLTWLLMDDVEHLAAEENSYFFLLHLVFWCSWYRDEIFH